MPTKDINQDYTILIIEDNQTSLDYLRFVFKRQGYSLLTATDAESGFDLFKNNKVDITITDISLPGFNGIELSRRIKEIQPEAVIVVVTAFSDARLLMQAIELRINNYVMKPVDKDVISQIVEKHINSIVLERNFAEQQKQLANLSLALQKSSSKVILLDINSKVIFTNDSFHEFTKFSIDNNLDLADIFDFEDLSTKYFRNAIENKIEWRGNVRSLKANGDFFWAFTTLTPLFNDDIFSGFVIILNDVTQDKQNFDLLKQDKQELEKLVYNRTEELQNMNNQLVSEIENRKLIEIELVEAKKKAESLNVAKSMFLAKVSHELRTPMNGVIGMTNLLLEGELTEKQRKLLGIVKFSSESLLSIINDLLDYSKIEFGKFQLDKAEFKFRELIDKVRNSLQSLADSKNLEFSVYVDDAIPDSLIGDSARIAQIINNLVSNSIKFTSSGKITLNLHLVENHDCILKIRGTVIDTGIGISKENYNKIFEGFTQIEPTLTRRYGGTGLGLSITKELIEMMKGDIVVESEIGKGSKFTFTIELNQSPMPGCECSVYDELDLLDYLSITRTYVMVVDDSKINLEVIDSILSEKGCKVTKFTNGYEAIEDFKNNHYDIVFVDILMPEINGFDTLTRLKEIKKSRNTPFIALTALNDDELVSNNELSNFDGFLLKPFKSQEIKDLILRHTVFNLEIADLSNLKEQVNNNSVSILRIINYFLSNIDNELSIVKSAFENDNTIKLKDTVHRMKSELSHLGAYKARSIASAIEGNTGKPKIELEFLINNYISCIQELKKYLETIKETI